MKIFAVAVLAVALSLVAVLAGAALAEGALPRGPDAAGFAVLTAAVGGVLIVVLHWPVLAGLRRRGVALDSRSAALVTTLGLNAPVYAVLAVLGRDPTLFGGGEAGLFALGFALLALVFGAGYARLHRNAAGRR